MRSLAPAAVLLYVCVSVGASVGGDAGDLDQCKEACAESFFLLPQIEDVQEICQRGCRIFNIIYLREDHDLNSTKEECHLSCNEAYTGRTEQLKSCEVGCSATWKRKEAADLSLIPLFLQFEQLRQQDRSGGAAVIVEPELEIVESEDLILEPLMQNQIEIIGYSVEYKIPEAKIRTMPIDDHWRTEEIVEAIDDRRGNSQLQQQQPSGDWLDCASRNSGIPKWFLLLAIIVAILAALFLSISSERKLIIDVEDDFDLEARLLIEADRRCRNEKEEMEEAEALPAKQPLHLASNECNTETERMTVIQL